MSIRAKLVLSFILIASIPMLIVALVFFGETKNEISNKLLLQQSSLVTQKARILESFVANMSYHAQLAGAYPPIQGIIHSESTGIDSRSNTTLEEWLNRLEIIFSSIVEFDGRILQVRYLDEDGNEIVRVNSDGGVPKIAENDVLQNKAARYYFSQTMGMDKGQVYVSPLDLNAENDVLETPYRPVMRFGVPLFSELDDSRQGISLINANISGVLDELASNDIGSLLLINQDGYFLHHPDKQKEFSFQLGADYNYFSEQPELIGSIQLYESREYHDKEDKEFRIWRKIHYDPHHPENYWVLFSVVNEDDFFFIIRTLRNHLIVIWVVLLGMVIIFSLTFGRLLVDPLRKLSKRAQSIAAGNLKTPIDDYQHNDEIGVLTQSFKLMVSNLTQSLRQTREANHSLGYEKQQLDIFLESIGDGVVAIDKKFKIILWNHAASLITGFSKEEAMGKPLKKILKLFYEKNRKPNYDFLREAIRTRKTRQMANHTFLVRKDGTEVPVADSAAPIVGRNDDLQGVIIIFRDVSKDREIEDMKNDFVSLTSHQLRTPLTGMKWQLQKMLKKVKFKPSETAIIKKTLEANERLIRLVNDLLNVSRLESGTLSVNPEDMDFLHFFDSLVDEIKPLAQHKKIKLVLKKPKGQLAVCLDPQLIAQVFGNLLSNSIKYSPSNTTITVLIKKAEKGFVVSVQDEGIGIAKQDQKRLFSKFFRANKAVDYSTSGTGLGLYIIKKILDICKGTIKVNSDENKGSTFTVTLPFQNTKKKGKSGKGLVFHPMS